MQFNNYRNRPGRQTDDRLAAIREVWSIFNDNLRNIYVPNKTLTVDKQLVGFVAKSLAEHICPQNQGSMVLSFFGYVKPQQDLLCMA